MLVQALASYADNYLAEELKDAAWERKPVPWLLEISTQGTFLSAVPHMIAVTRGKKQVQVRREMDVPRSPVNRNSGEHPLLSVDDIAYVLGAGPWTPAKAADREKAEKHHEAFVTLIGKAAAETGDSALQACVRFYGNPPEVERAREALTEAKAGSLVALSVGGVLVHCEAVQSFWRRHYLAAFSGRMEGSVGECLITGKTGAIAPTHEKIKGISSLKGQAAGVALMSFDKEAFRSYGWEQNQNSPVAPDRALAYVLALNDLLRLDKGKRKDIAGVGFIFWLRNPAPFNPFDVLDPPDTDTVKAMLTLDPGVDPDPNAFYLAGVSGNGGRLRVRYWVTDSLPHIKQNLRQWHDQLQVAFPWDDSGPVRFWQLEYAIHREGKPPAHHTIALLRRAIEGPAQPLGYSVLSTALTRLRHPGGGDSREKSGNRKNEPMSLPRLRVPMGLIRLCINDIHRLKGVKEMSEGLDTSCAIPAYVCGRLMAEFESLQRASNEGEINSSVLDRYFALASTYPSVAFPKIENLAQKHLRKLRRDNPKAAYAIDTRLQELHNKLRPTEAGAYPAKLSLEGQGLFALGYYHQKAWSISQARSRKQSNESSNQDVNQENQL
jgi:CRISPR-associated protein Csd1